MLEKILDKLLGRKTERLCPFGSRINDMWQSCSRYDCAYESMTGVISLKGQTYCLIKTYQNKVAMLTKQDG